MVILRWTSVLVFAALAGCGSYPPDNVSASSVSKAPTANVGCIGRILPEQGTFFVAPTLIGGRIPVVTDVRIRPGDEVMPGQIIATLSSGAMLSEAAGEAEARLGLARARLARVKAGSTAAEVAVGRAEVARLELQRAAAAKDVERNKPLLEKDYIPKAHVDALEARVRDTDALLQQAREKLNGIGNVRPEDIAIAEQEVRVAESELARAQQDASTSVVRAQARGRVLRVLAHPGEPVGPEGIAEMADTSRMVVMAEVYEADIARVHTGQKAIVTSNLLPHALTGRVAWIGSNIERQEPVSAEPGAPSDSRVFRVRIEMPDQGLLGQRINGKVDVVIEQ